jgi:hydroxymethylglutaryl-CoA reductase
MALADKRSERIRSFIFGHKLGDSLTAPELLKDVRIENCIGFTRVPLGLAGPLQLKGPDPIGTLFMDKICAPLATCEPTLVASCSRGCKAFNISGGVNYEILGDGMSRAPVFVFDDPGAAVCFARAIPALREKFAEWAGSTSQHVKLLKLDPSVIGPRVHLFCMYHCGSAAGQNMVTKATKYACDMLRENYETKFFIRDFFIEGQLACDKSASWGNVKSPRGVEVVVWGTITNQACEAVFKCTTDRLYMMQNIAKDGGIRNGQFGSNINTANIIAAMFIATGQDAGSVAEASWSPR